MKLPAQMTALAGRFDRLSARERLFVLIAAIAVLVGAFKMLLLGPLDVRAAALSQQLAGLQSGIDETTKAAASDATTAAYAQQADLKARLATVNTELESRAAGMIAPQRMADVIHDVLSRQQGVKLVSLRNLEAIKLPLDAAGEGATNTARPYEHTVEIVLEGRYLDVLAYLHALEALPWRFYWRRLELTTTRYPVNRVRVELGTVSMDSDWIDL
ncbi:MAG TPA: type II secretion system protein GspM [Steroidobacteraceae bacterium]|jgi:MSHA biogenesis protein MshJ|nr:type II secretion system protein GspM [Steroidobacteraceae bacterium]